MYKLLSIKTNTWIHEVVYPILLGCGTILLLMGFTYIAVQAVDNYKQASLQWTQETTCVNQLIQQGTKRINIATNNGTCWVEVNGYYRNKI